MQNFMVDKMACKISLLRSFLIKEKRIFQNTRLSMEDWITSSPSLQIYIRSTLSFNGKLRKTLESYTSTFTFCLCVSQLSPAVRQKISNVLCLLTPSTSPAMSPSPSLDTAQLGSDGSLPSSRYLDTYQVDILRFLLLPPSKYNIDTCVLRHPGDI